MPYGCNRVAVVGRLNQNTLVGRRRRAGLPALPADGGNEDEDEDEDEEDSLLPLPRNQTPRVRLISGYAFGTKVCAEKII